MHRNQTPVILPKSWFAVQTGCRFVTPSVFFKNPRLVLTVLRLHWRRRSQCVVFWFACQVLLGIASQASESSTGYHTALAYCPCCLRSGYSDRLILHLRDCTAVFGLLGWRQIWYISFPDDPSANIALSNEMVKTNAFPLQRLWWWSQETNLAFCQARTQARVPTLGWQHWRRS